MQESSHNNEKPTFGNGFAGNSAKEHLDKRQSEGYYSDLTVAQYQNRALELLQQEVGENIDGYETKSGKIVRWNKTTNDYATGYRDREIKTLFPLRGGRARFDRLKENDERNGV